MSNKGWICPKCDKVYSPDVKECKDCNWQFNQYPPKWVPRTGTGDFPIQSPNTSNEYCLMDEFIRQNPGQSVAMLYCPCPKCSPKC